MRPFAGSSLHFNQNFNSSFLSSDGFRPRNDAPGISASVRIESHAAIAVAVLEMHDARGLSGLALAFVVTIPPERSAITKVVYSARANITPDEDFKSDIGSIRKKAEHALEGALVKFHHRRIERLTIKIRKLEQAKSRKSNFVNKQSPNSKQPPTSEKQAVKNQNVDELATVILAKISDTLLERIRSETNNKRSEAYPIVLSDPLVIREEGIENKHNKAAKNRKRKVRRKDREKSITRTPFSHAKNISRTCQIHN